MKARFNGPKGVSWSPFGIYIADTENHGIRRLDEKTGVIITMAGTGTRGDGPVGDPLKCQFARPHGILVLRNALVPPSNSVASPQASSSRISPICSLPVT
jgi:hypothetical protein